MADKTQKPPVAPIPSSVPPVAPDTKGTHTQRANEYGQRLRTAIATISEKSPSSARCMLDAYFPFIAPSRRLQRDQMFPRTVRRHVRSEERSTESGNKFLVLFFHVGNTILGYYDAAAAIDGPEDWFNERATVLGNRVRLLEVIAREGIDAFVIEGSDGTGFALAHKKEQREKAEFKDDSRFMH